MRELGWHLWHNARVIHTESTPYRILCIRNTNNIVNTIPLLTNTTNMNMLHYLWVLRIYLQIINNCLSVDSSNWMRARAFCVHVQILLLHINNILTVCGFFFTSRKTSAHSNWVREPSTAASSRCLGAWDYIKLIKQ